MENKLQEVWEVYKNSSECLVFLTEELAKNQKLIYGDCSADPVKLSLSKEEIKELETKGYLWID